MERHYPWDLSRDRRPAAGHIDLVSTMPNGNISQSGEEVSTLYRVHEEVMTGSKWCGRPALLLTQLKWSLPLPNRELHVVLVAHFQPTEIQRGTIVKTTLYVGCSGATFFLDVSGGGLICWWTSEDKREADREIASSTETSLSLVPKLKTPLGDAARASAELGGATSKSAQKASSTFQGRADARLTDLCYQQKRIRWSYDMDRVPAEVRDYLEETLELKATVHLDARERALALESTSQPKDRVFFGSNRRKLSALASFALYARLRAAGVTIPEPDPVVHRVSFELQ